MDSSVTLRRNAALSGCALKRVAIISMVIDHFGSIIMDGLLAPYRSAEGFIFFDESMPWYIFNAPTIKTVCSIIGSLAFPIFCFLISEGFVHTRSRAKYALRMGIFALASEIPYDLAHYGRPFDFSLQNVMFTLTVGILTLMALDAVARSFSGKRALRAALSLVSVALGCGLAYLIRAEYVFLGVLSISLMYLLRGNRWSRALGWLPLVVVSPWTLVSLIPVFFYSGRRGNGSKYFFYLFYPAHLLLFAGIAWLLA